MSYDIKNGSIFIADAHENDDRDYFWQFLLLVEKGQIKPASLFLMGDMFDLLVGEVKLTHKFAQKYIEKLEMLALKFPIFYFEGNHDFNLSSFFKNVKVFSFNDQPQVFKSPAGDILLLHGDRYENFLYRFYTYFIRNSTVCKGINILNNALKGFLHVKILKNQKSKNICKKIDGFKDMVFSKLKFYPTINIKAILEGHYHQNKKFSYNDLVYYNFSSFACDQSYFVVQFDPSMKITQLNLRGKHGNNV